MAVDIHEEKLDLASELGADYIVIASERDPVQEIQRLGDADAAVDTADSSGASEQAYGSLKPGGHGW